VEAPDETSALKAAIEEFGIINPEHQSRLFVRRVPSDDDWIADQSRALKAPKRDGCHRSP
jgi:hypothetical protein